MKTYARIEAGTVAELLRTEADPALFHPSLRWLETRDPAVAVGWVDGAAGLVPPPPATAPAMAEPPSLEALHAELVKLAAQVAALTPR